MYILLEHRQQPVVGKTSNTSKSGADVTSQNCGNSPTWRMKHPQTSKFIGFVKHSTLMKKKNSFCKKVVWLGQARWLVGPQTL